MGLRVTGMNWLRCNGDCLVKEHIMNCLSVSIVQHPEGTATVSCEGPSGRPYHVMVCADDAVLVSALLIGWARDCMAFEPVCEGR